MHKLFICIAQIEKEISNKKFSLEKKSLHRRKLCRFLDFVVEIARLLSLIYILTLGATPLQRTEIFCNRSDNNLYLSWNCRPRASDYQFSYDRVKLYGNIRLNRAQLDLFAKIIPSLNPKSTRSNTDFKIKSCC